MPETKTLTPNQAFFNQQTEVVLVAPKLLTKEKQTEEVPQVEIPHLSRIWVQCLQFIKERDFESAYRLIIAEGDDLYLLRLMLQTGPILKFLQAETAE